MNILKILLSFKPCDPNQQNANGDTALHIVSRMTLSFDTKLQLLLSTPGINLEVLNNEHLTPFEAADKDFNTVLHNACAEGKYEMIQLLIENGADVYIKTRQTWKCSYSYSMPKLQIGYFKNPFKLQTL